MALEKIIRQESSWLVRVQKFSRRIALRYSLGISLAAAACAGSDTVGVASSDGGTKPDSGIARCVDNDQDGFYAAENCGTLVDCDDQNSAIYPGAFEFCDEIDNNCKDGIDEGVTRPFYEDKDKDGFGNGDPAKVVQACLPPKGNDPDTLLSYVENADDCDDNDFHINPNALEDCDGLDNNCNDLTDENLLVPTQVCTAGEGQCQQYGSEYKTCLGAAGWSAGYSGCDAVALDPLPEECDSLDNDCDGFSDNNLNYPSQPCSAGVGACQASGLEYKTCLGELGWSTDYSDCDAVEGTPSAEICDGFDNDCNDIVDDGVLSLYFLDNDNDGFGYVNEWVQACSALPGYVANFFDCNDNDSAINPFAGEICDGIDNNCANGIDEGLTPPSQPCSVGMGACKGLGLEYKICLGGAGWSAGYSGCDAIEGQSAPEICDGLDNDCNEVIDDNLTPSSQPCSLGEGECQAFGLEYKICQGAAGWSQTYTNCDAVPGQPTDEICDGLDNNCNGQTDEGLIQPFYRDQDGDGLGNPNDSVQGCLPPDGYVVDNTDCDDTDPDNGPGLSQLLDDFNRPDQNGLGTNALGNLWAEAGQLDDWDIINNTAETSYTGGPAANPKAYSIIGHRNHFDLEIKWKTNNVSAVGGGVVMVIMNADSTGSAGFLARLCVANCSVHNISSPTGLDSNSDTLPPLSAGVYYLTRFKYDGTNLMLKIWEDGAAEPLDFLITGSTADTPASQNRITISSDLDTGESAAVTIDYIIDKKGCQ